VRRKEAVAIVGGGLGGLYLARLLAERGREFVLLEAQPRLGGRIRSVPSEPAGESRVAGRYDVGPTWYWPGAQPRMTALVAQLGLRTFPQPTDGEMLVEQAVGRPMLRFPTYSVMPPSMRLAGGVQSLIEALAGALPPARLRTGVAVQRLTRTDEGVELAGVDGQGRDVRLDAAQVVVTLPPRLAAATLAFAPAPSAATLAGWSATPTWMAGHAKLVAVYDTAFWREAGLSGSAQSRVGPLGEIHDASDPAGAPALFGFFGLDAEQRRARGREALEAAAIAQLARIFGEQAASPSAVFLQDWAAEPFVATEQDRGFLGHHPAYGPAGDPGEPWHDRLVLAGTEAAAVSGGYLEGALVAAEAAAAWCG
jgi:monoamine oxidase